MVIILETPRLILREWTADDTDVTAVFALYRDPEVTRYLKPGVTPPNVEVMRKALAQLIAEYEATPGLGYWAIVERASEAVIGTGLLASCDDGIEVGYHLARQAWGQGYATEIARALVAYGFAQVGLTRIVGRAYPENLASRRVLEKAGLTFLGIRADGGDELAWYEIARPEGLPSAPA